MPKLTLEQFKDNPKLVDTYHKWLNMEVDGVVISEIVFGVMEQLSRPPMPVSPRGDITAEAGLFYLGKSNGYFAYHDAIQALDKVKLVEQMPPDDFGADIDSDKEKN